MILFDSVTKRFGNRTVLENINFEIQPGEFISIIGNSGAGKTTFIKLLLGDESPSEGSIFINGENFAELDNEKIQQYRRNIGCIFQDYKLLPGKTVFENVAFALESVGFGLSDRVDMTNEALQSLGIMHLKDQRPHELSGGEAQRVALARAIVHKPKLIVADEPTGNLDFENAKLVIKNLLKINMDGVAVLLTTHNKPLVDLIGQKICHLQEGHLS